MLLGGSAGHAFGSVGDLSHKDFFALTNCPAKTTDRGFLLLIQESPFSLQPQLVLFLTQLEDGLVFIQVNIIIGNQGVDWDIALGGRALQQTKWD